MPSPEEWAARNRVLAETLSSLLQQHSPDVTGRALEIGCQWGLLLDRLASQSDKRWWGVDPVIERHRSRRGYELVNGTADKIPFPDAAFDCVVLANMYEHVPPHRREASLREIARVLIPGGVLVGQLPNPRFPIESHSKLPFMGWLPPRAQNWYWRLSPARRGAGFYSVTVGDLKRRANGAGFDVMLIKKFNYPVEAAPQGIRWLVRRMHKPMAVVPWSWQFVLRRR
ncbi:MAG: class I SAM-dependent methyltransferase [Rubrobacter sp.]|nr:class I SAM-dependent methyltransferase [Rubrobacter sp.]